MHYSEFGLRHWFTLGLAIFGNAFITIAGLTRQEEICTAVTPYPLTPYNKEKGQYAVNINSKGIVFRPAKRSLSTDAQIVRAYKIQNRREKQNTKNNNVNDDIRNKLSVAASHDVNFNHLDYDDNFQKLVHTFQTALSYKQQAYYSALVTQQGNNVGNCGEHADMKLVYYIKDQLMTGERTQLQRFTLVLENENIKENHGFVVRNSGVPGQSITNDPAAVKKLLGQIDNQPDAYLCDHEYNGEEGHFGKVRQENKIYGINSEVSWTGLNIHDYSIELDLSKLPKNAVEVRKTLKQINHDLNQKILKDIEMPVLKTDNQPSLK